MNLDAALPHCPPGADERALAEALRARRPDAWAHVFDTHYDQVYRYALVRTADTSTAADLAATTFVEALKSAHTYTYRGRPVLAWLYTIARNVIAAHYKAQEPERDAKTRIRELLRFRQTDERVPAIDLASDDADPAQSIERLDVIGALRRLPRDEREVIALRYYAGLPLVEVARLLGKPERRVYSLQARAIEGLRRALSQEGGKLTDDAGNSPPSGTYTS